LGERILEIVFYLVQHMRNNDGVIMQLEDVSRSLKNMGFSENEISSAYGWFLEELQTRGGQQLLKGGRRNAPPRLFSEAEKQLLSTRARGYLIQLYQMGIINAEQFEAILDRIGMLEAVSLDVKSLKIIASSIIFGGFNKNYDLNWFNFSGDETAH